MVVESEMSWETTHILAADTADVLAADTKDVLAAHTRDVLAADTTDVLAADKYVASEEVGLRRSFPGKNNNPLKKRCGFCRFLLYIKLYFVGFWYI